MRLLESRTGYSRAEWISDAVIHVAGLVIVLAAVPVLITLTAFVRGDAPALVGISVYGAALVLMILFSALYNMFSSEGSEWLLKRLDHSAIYLKIAATYTPFTVLNGQGTWLLAGIWGAAITGVSIKLVSPYRFRPFTLVLYVAMGWAGVAAGNEFFSGMSPLVFNLLLAGGLIYTAGVGFYLASRLPFHNTIWHGFVLTASLTLYSAVLIHVTDHPL